MIANILFFIGWTVAIFILANKKVKELIEVIHTLNSLNNKLIENQNELNILENFSGLLGKQYLFKQDDGTYYNRYTDEYMASEEATDWLYSELSSIINKVE